MQNEYGIGSVIVQNSFGNPKHARVVTVTGRYPDIKNGRPGFEGTTYDPNGVFGAQRYSVWGYDSEVASVIQGKEAADGK